jgi:tRNA(fMet)-specific endonuclease VapC
MGVILDSSVLIAAERGRFRLEAFLSTHSDEVFFITVITASELLHGCARAGDPGIRERRMRFVEDVLRDYAVLPMNLAEARTHAQLWAELEAKGALIGERDLLIASIAQAGGHSLATLNRDEFARVPGLVLLEAAPFELPGASRR